MSQRTKANKAEPNGQPTQADVPALLATEQAARSAHYAANPDGRARTPEGRKALSELVKARQPLMALVGGTWREVQAKLGYKPQFAIRAKAQPVAPNAKAQPTFTGPKAQAKAKAQGRANG